VLGNQLGQSLQDISANLPAVVRDLIRLTPLQEMLEQPQSNRRLLALRESEEDQFVTLPQGINARILRCTDNDGF
jgi:hypothetical protein